MSLHADTKSMEAMICQKKYYGTDLLKQAA